MTVTTKAKAAPRAVDLKAVVSKLRGDTAETRTIAFMAIAPNSFSEDVGRTRSIDNLRVALGKNPSPVAILAAKTQWVIGRAASRLPAGELPSKDMGAADRIIFTEKLVLDYASPAVEGKTARPLRKGQAGRRSPMQHRVIRNAEEAWSQVAAELAIGNAKTQGERNKAKAKRSARMAGSGATPPTHSALVKAEKPVDADAACAFMMQHARTGLDYANKYAKLIPVDYGTLALAYHSGILKAHQAREKAAKPVKA